MTSVQYTEGMRRIYLASFAEPVPGKDHVEGIFTHFWGLHPDEAVGCLFQQQRASQIRILRDRERI